jgi:hypothetical protein
MYCVFRTQADWTIILPSELPAKMLRHLARKMPPQAYQTSQYVVPRGGIWRSIFAGSSDGKMNVQSACALNTVYMRKLLTYIAALTFIIGPVGHKFTDAVKIFYIGTQAILPPLLSMIHAYF